MNVRLKKEMQLLFWPWLICVIFGFLPLIVLSISILLFDPQSDQARLSNYRQTAFFIANTTFVVGAALLASLPFGSELQQRTLGMLFSQPMSRLQIWREKIMAILIAVFTLTLAHTMGQLANFAELLPNLEFAILFLMVVVCSGIFWSLFSRSVLGGIVLSLFSMVVLYVGANVITDFHGFILSTTYRLSSTRLFVATASLLAAPIFLGLAWLKFSRMEPTVSWENESAAEGTARSRFGLPWLRCQPSSPVYNFIIKELYLLRPVFFMMGAFAFLWAGMVLGASMIPAKARLFSGIFDVAGVVYLALTILMAGCISLGEEKKLGIHNANLSSPLSAFRQWFLKNSLSSVTGLIATVLLFSVMTNLTANRLETSFLVKVFHQGTAFIVIASILVFCLIQISFGTAVIANRTNLAALLSVLVTIGTGVFLYLGGTLGSYLHLPIQKPLYYLVAHGQMTCWLAQQWTTSAYAYIWLFSCLSIIYAGWKCYRYLHSETQRFIKVLIIMLSVTLPLAVLRGAAEKQLERENFMKSSLCQEVKSAFVSLNMDVFPSDKNQEVDVKHETVMATEKISPLTKAWLRDCKFIVIYEPEKALSGNKPTIRVIVQFTKPGRYETIYLKPRNLSQ